MNGTNESLRRKISGAGDLEAVVRSMKALAASNIGQYERAVAALDDYYRTVELGLAACFRQAGPIPVPTSKSRGKSRPVGVIVFGSNQGLVGKFNEVLAECSTRTFGTAPGKVAKIWAVGERIHTLMADAGLSQSALLSAPTSVNAITPLVGRLLIDIVAAQERGEVTEIYLFHNRPKSGATYEPTSRQLLPLDRLWQNKLAALPWPTKNSPEVIEGIAAALPAFVRGYLFVLLFQACAESLASENASRLAAMQRAEKNIDGILEELTRTFHRLRQESIDEELFEVISGYEALLDDASKASRRSGAGRH
jgi:F-type H+-transporting ATPase subunit gamma